MSDQPVSMYTVARELLTENFALSTDEVMSRIKARGVTRPDPEIRKMVNKTRSDMRLRDKPKRGAGRGPSAYTLARELLTADPTLSNDAALARIKARGVTKADPYIREAIRGTRNDLRHAAPPAPAPAAARTTAGPKAAPAGSDEEAMFAAIGMVNKTAQLCGGVAKSRAIADAIRCCGGLDVFLKRLDFVAEILGSETEL